MKRTTKELDWFVRKKLRKGYPEGELKNELLAEGFSIEEVETAFYNSISRVKDPGKEDAGKYPLWFFLSVGFLILGISLTAVKGLWLEPWSIPLMIAGMLGIATHYIIVNNKRQKENSAEQKEI